MSPTSFFAVVLSCALLSTATFALRSDESDELEPDTALTQSEMEHFYEGISRIGLGTMEIVSTGAEFVWQRVPNRDELLYDVGLGSLVEIGLNGMGLDLGRNNPAAKAIVRDISKVITVVPKVFSDVEVGSTGIKFDSSNVISQIAKPLSKAAGIIVLQKTMGYDGELASEKANYVGDTVSRAIVLAGIERQKSNSTLPFHEYVVENPNVGWGFGALIQVIPKMWIVTQISGGIKGYKVGDVINGFVYKIGGKILNPGVVGTSGILGTGSFLRAQQYNRIVAYSAAFMLNYVSVAAVQLVNTYLLATSARITMDVVDWSAGRISEKAQTFYAWAWPSANPATVKEEL